MGSTLCTVRLGTTTKQMTNKKLLLTGLTCGALATALTARADENLMGYSYGAETLPKGKWEAYSWTTARIGKDEGRYLGLDVRQELEYGITDRLQASLYFNERYNYAKNAAGSGEAIPDINSFGFDGTQLAFKYNVLSPYKDKFGLAFYLEPGYSRIEKITGERGTEYELEYKVILQKNFLDDTLVAQLNLTGESAWERAEGESEYETELALEASGGLSYRFARNWWVGLESRVHTELPEYEKFEHVAWFLGPNIHYGGKKWWATLTVLPQVAGWPDERGKGGKFLAEHEQVEVRLKVGYNF